MINSIANLIGSFAWPLAVIIIVIIFRKGIGKLLERLIHAKYPGGEAFFGFGNTDIDKQTEKRTEVAQVPVNHVAENQHVYGGGNWNNFANVFWLGHDIMFAIDIILRGAPRNNIIKALSQILHHARSIDIKRDPIIVRLDKLFREAENSLDSDWNNTKRRIVVSELVELRDIIGKIVEEKQPNFEPCSSN